MLNYVKSKLNEEQFLAAIHTDTSSLILAGAGSGKTRTLIYKIAYLIFAKNIRPDRILAVTFTNKAANEMKERLLTLAEEVNTTVMKPVQKTDTTTKNASPNNTPNDEMDFDAMMDSFVQEVKEEPSHSMHREILVDRNSLKWIGTFHSIFLKMLKEDIEALEAGYNKNFGIYDSNETLSIVKKIIKDKGRDADVDAREAKGFISKCKNEGIPYTAFSVSSDYEKTMAILYESYQKELIGSNSLDFDDLLLLPFLIFKKDERVLQKWQRRFDYMMVDEAQDTNRIQFELMKMISGEKGNITLIGDDFQSIYGRRGALMENFLNVKRYWPDIVMFKLQVNYRSKPHIVSAGSAIIKNNKTQYEKDIKAHREGDNKILVFTHSDQTDEAINIIDFIRKFHDEKKAPRSDFAILYRTNAQSSPFEQILVQEGIPYKIYGAFKFFERKEIKDILSYVKYLKNPKDNLALKRIINVPGRKIGDTTVSKVEDYAIMNELSMYEVIDRISSTNIDLGKAAIGNLQGFMQTVQALRNEIPHLRPAEVMALVLKKINYKEYLIKEEGSEELALEKYENIGQLINLAEKYEETGEEGLSMLMDEITLLTDLAEQDEGSMDAIKLMTAHSSKGLEFKNVFVAGLEENIFPLSNARLETKLLEEERRLMYVAVTRAEDHLFLSHANSRMQWGNMSMNAPSRFIEEIPEILLKKYDLSNSGGSSSHQGSYTSKLQEGDWVKHKLFGEGELIEIRNYVGLVRFSDTKFGLRKIPLKLLQKA